MNIIQEFFHSLPLEWCWLLAGTILISLEIMLPEVYLLWLGFAAIITAVVSFFTDVSLVQQVIIFSLTSLALVIFAKLYLKKNKTNSGYKNLNKRMHSYIGTEVELLTTTKNGKSRICLDDAFWVVEGASNLPEGTICTITGIRGMNFQVIQVGD